MVSHAFLSTAGRVRICLLLALLCGCRPPADDESARQRGATSAPASPSPAPRSEVVEADPVHGSTASAPPQDTSPTLDNPPPDTGALRSRPLPETPGAAPRTGDASRDAAGANESPWSSASPPEEFPRFRDIAFAPLAPERSYPDRAELERWLEAVPGSKPAFREVRIRSERGTRVTGHFRLRAPWRETAALRIEVDNSHGWMVHLVSGDQGVTLVSYQNDQMGWAAYRTTRRDGAVIAWALAATDQLRNRRLSLDAAGRVDIWYHDGHVVLLRGDVELLAVPLAGAPDEVFFSGGADIAGIDLVDCRDFERPADKDSAEIQWSPVAERPWLDRLGAGATRQVVGDSVRLVATRAGAPGWSVTPLDRDGVGLTVVRLDDATAGVGVFLGGGPDTPPGEMVRFVQNRQDGRLCVEARFADDVNDSFRGELEQRLIPCAGSTVWIRMLSACGMLRWWLSGDGANWAEVELSRANTLGQATHLGLYHVAGLDRCQVTLSAIGTIDLPQINLLADPVVSAGAEPVLGVADFGQWLAACRERQPSGVAAESWITACAVRTLSGGSNRDIGNGIVDWLWNSEAAGRRSVAERLELLRELAWFEDLRQGSTRIAAARARYRDLAVEAADHGESRPYTAFRRAAATSPLAVRSPFPAVDESAIRREIVHLVYAHEWDELRHFCRMLRFYEFSDRVLLAEWAERLAAERLGIWSPAERPSQPGQWRQPSIEHISREVYSTVSELRALVDHGDAVEAARTMAALDLARPELRGLASGPDDAQLLRSLPAAIEALFSTSELFARAVLDTAQLGELRLRQAMQRGDAEAVAQVAVQFAGTRSAGLARRWLGDNALSQGWFEHALVQFKSRDHRTLTPTGDGTARIRLAAALLGERLAGEVDRASFGSHEFSANEFESLIGDVADRAELRRHAASFLEPSAASALSFRRLGEAHAAWTGGLVRHAGREIPARNVALERRGDTLYVVGPQQAEALRAGNGNRIWLSSSLFDAPRQDPWALVTPHPLVTPHLLAARHTQGESSAIVAVDRGTGRFRWIAGNSLDLVAVSDPFVLDGRMLCLAMRPSPSADQWVLSLADLDHETGALIAAYDLVEFAQSWWTQRDATVRVLGDRFAAAAGGVLLVADARGRVRWLRRQDVLPATLDTAWMSQAFQPPLSSDGRLLALLPGTSTVDCLDAATGTLHWRAVLPGAEQLLGAFGDRVVARTDRQLLGLDRADGRVVWRHPARNWLGGFIDPATGRLLFVNRRGAQQNLPPRENSLEVIWLDTAAGNPATRTVIDLPGPYADGRLVFGALTDRALVGLHLPDAAGRPASVVTLSIDE